MHPDTPSAHCPAGTSLHHLQQHTLCLSPAKQCKHQKPSQDSFVVPGECRELSRVDTACGRLHYQVAELLAVGFCKHLLPVGFVVPPGVQYALPQG